MNVQQIQQAVSRFKEHLANDRAFSWSILWETTLHFQQHWRPEADDFVGMFDQSLANPTSRRLWKRDHFFPKETMLRFIEMQPDFVRMMFADLFNEEKSIDGRLDRFVFYCDEMLREYKEQHPTSVVNNHYHGDYQMVSLYLSWRFPERYAYYHFPLFEKLMPMLQARDLPRVNDVSRYFKVMQTLQRFLEKDTSIQESHRARLDPARHYEGSSLALAVEMAAVYAGVSVLP